MITAILVDDDVNLRKGMKKLIQRYAPEINILGEAEGVEEAIEVFNKVNPQVLFLDIRLNDGTGFDILEKLTATSGKVESQVVFITAHEEYAIRAFRFSALDFFAKTGRSGRTDKSSRKNKKYNKKNGYFR